MNLFDANLERPLADRVRPEGLDGFVGQSKIVSGDGFVRKMIDSGIPASLILWGPPGSGKTTLARIIAAASNGAFIEISAVTSGIADVKKVIEGAKARRAGGTPTLLFVDEIHRFNKAQQDAFLPHVENGTITLIGATTENPSFEVIGPLLSRTRVVVLEPHSVVDLEQIIERGLSELKGVAMEPAAKKLLAELSAGDARVALGGLETAAGIAKGVITAADITQALQKRLTHYDKGGEFHYNLASAFIKSLRGGAVDAALFYLAWMIEAGEEPKFIARRMIIFASEDIGIADNSMLSLATSASLAVERVGMPEGRLILSHVTIALALAAKDRSATNAIGAATQAVAANPNAEVPLQLRNAPTKLMSELGYGEGYKWEAGFNHQKGFMPNGLEQMRFFDPPQNT